MVICLITFDVFQWALMKGKRIIFWWFLTVFTGIATTVFGEQLSVKDYTSADNLVHDRVRAIKRDSRGFLWFCTGDGLSRFDGYAFTNYGSAQGLPQPAVNDLIERRDGSYWLATNGGAVLFNPAAATGETKFTLFQFGDQTKNIAVQTFYEDRADRLWAGTAQGLFYLDESSGQKQFQQVSIDEIKSVADNPESGTLRVNKILEDAEGSLWLATGGGLVRRLPNGKNVFYRFAGAEKHPLASSLVFDDSQRLWVGMEGGLLIIKPELAAQVQSDLHLINAAPQKSFAANAENIALPEKDGTENWFVPQEGERAIIFGLTKLADGSIWIANRGTGLFTFQNGTLRKYTTEQGLSENYVNVIEEDTAGNIWIGTESSGANRITRHGFTAFRDSDGLKRKYIREVFETNTGEIVAITNATEMAYLSGDRFVPLRLSISPDLVVSGTLGRETPFQDHTGEWWIAARDGLYHYSKLENLEAFANAKPDIIYTEKNGLPNLKLVAVNEDSRGDIWLGTIGDVPLIRRERATGKFYAYSESDGVPRGHTPTGFAETANGDVFFSFVEGDILRYRGGKFHLFTSADGIPAGTIPTLFADSRGHLWIPSWRGGAARIDNPADDKLNLTTFTTANGLASINARCVTEDAQGRIYIGTVRGVDRLEPESGQISHYAVADGLSNSEIGTCFRDSKNNLWFATYRGLSKFVPEDAEDLPPSPTLLNGLRVAGVAVPISEVGVSAINELQFEPSENQLQIDFFSLNFAAGENLRYQYRLEGANDEWSAPNNLRTVNFANLAAGNYRFFVRAVDSAGKIGDAATVDFKVLPPVYRRWWFLTLAGLIIAAAIFGLDRFRVKKTKQVETALEISRESEARFRTLAQTASDAIITVNKDSRIVFVNDAAEKIFGFTEKELIGEDLKILMPGSLREKHDAEMKRDVEMNESLISQAAIELSGNHKDGRKIPLELSIGEFTSGGERYFTGIARDISERKKAEENLQRAAEIEQKAKTDRLRELEQVRRRIAADLHDDIGSSLTQISIFSEVLQQRIDKSNERVLEPLEFIAGSSRELVDAMSDIVWAINPQKDSLSELSGKMRRFAADVFSARNIRLKYEVFLPEDDLALGANLRREVFLIFKESVNNIVKHSKCTAAEIELIVENAEIRLSLHDDGAGFDVDKITDGHGLVSMKQRAAGLNGNLEIVSNAGNGTTTKLQVPLGANAGK